MQVKVAGQTPAVRHGEVLVADSERIEGWRNLGQAEAVLFWIVSLAARFRDPALSGPPLKFRTDCPIPYLDSENSAMSFQEHHFRNLDGRATT